MPEFHLKVFVHVREAALLRMLIKDRKEVIQSLQGQTGLNILKNDDSSGGKFMKKQYLRVFVEKAPFSSDTHSKSNPEQPGVLGNDH